MSVVGGALPAGARRTSFDVPGGPLAAVELASVAEPYGTVLLVPGFTGSKEDFGPVLPALAEGGWRVVAIDQRGQHESAGPADPAAYTVAALGRDVLALRDLLDGPVHLLGHSFGGLVAREAVLARPTAFRSLVLLCSGPAAIPGPHSADRLAFLRPLLDAGGLPAVLEAMEATEVQDPQRLPSPQQREFLRRRFLASTAQGLLGMAEALVGEPDRVAELLATGVPVLVAHGRDDDAWPPVVQREMAKRLGAAYAVVPEAWHSPAVENPAATADALLEFWRR